MSNAPTTTETAAGRPTWTLGDRLAKARRSRKLSVSAAAEYFEVSEKTISNYEHDRTSPARATVLQWAMWTGWDARWLEHGVEPDNGPDGSGEQEMHGSRWNLPGDDVLKIAPVLPMFSTDRHVA